MKYLFVIVLYFFDISSQQTISFGKCPKNIEVIKKLDLGQYLGIWYEQYRYFIATDIGHTCSRINYTHSEEGPLLYSAINFNQWRDKYTAKRGTLKIDGQEGEGRFLIEYSGNVNEPVMHWILDTDYKSFSIIWSCKSERGFRFQNVWVYTRDQHPSEDVLRTALDILKKYDISPKYLTKTDQLNCCNCNVEEEIKTDEERSREEFYDDEGDVEIIYDMDNLIFE